MGKDVSRQVGASRRGQAVSSLEYYTTLNPPCRPPTTQPAQACPPPPPPPPTTQPSQARPPPLDPPTHLGRRPGPRPCAPAGCTARPPHTPGRVTMGHTRTDRQTGVVTGGQWEGMGWYGLLLHGPLPSLPHPPGLSELPSGYDCSPAACLPLYLAVRVVAGQHVVGSTCPPHIGRCTLHGGRWCVAGGTWQCTSLLVSRSARGARAPPSSISCLHHQTHAHSTDQPLVRQARHARPHLTQARADT